MAYESQKKKIFHTISLVLNLLINTYLWILFLIQNIIETTYKVHDIHPFIINQKKCDDITILFN